MQKSSERDTDTSHLSIEDSSASLQSPKATKEPKQLDACVICLEPVSERAVAVPCNHCAFDFICIITWLQGNSQCPLCKTELTTIQYDWRTPDDYKEYYIIREPSPRQEPPHPVRGGTPRVRSRASRYRPHRTAFAEDNAERVNHDLAISRRRYVYRHKLYSLHVGSNRISHFSDFTPQTFSRTPELQSRARKWIRRELQVFDFLNPSENATPYPPQQARHLGRRNSGRSRLGSRTDNAEFLLEYIVAILKTVDIKSSSGHAQTMLREFLGEDNAPLFLHELSAWLRSPYSSLDDWDRHVQYRVKLPGFSNIPPTCAQAAPQNTPHTHTNASLEHFRHRGALARRRYEAD